ncbi:beta-lactamase-like protein [Terfezia claveryi]|nr:beta-lactamase-like protein [Terfezia claveryi]
MPPAITILPLGTASAVPSKTRNHSSLALLLPSSNTLLFDVGEGTQNQLQKNKHLSPSKITKIFITHLHGDHISGLCPLLSTLCNGHGGRAEGEEDPRLANTGKENRPEKATIEIFGPKGLREYVRHTLRLTYTHLGGWISVHELLLAHEEETPNTTDMCYVKEIPGNNLRQDKRGFWKDIFKNEEFNISAGEIRHSIPSIGYVVIEEPLPGKIPKEYPKIIASYKEYFRARGIANPMSLLSALQSGQTISIHLPDNSILPRPPPRPGRKTTILGDTYDPSSIAPLAQNSTVLIHEATNAYLPSVDPNTKSTETYELVKERAMSRGHSTPEMAGLFARDINLGVTEDGYEVEGTLILNHFSSRYKDDEAEGPEGQAKKIMNAIRYCAENAWCNKVQGSGLDRFDMDNEASVCNSTKKRVICARDGVKIEIKVYE